MILTDWEINNLFGNGTVAQTEKKGYISPYRLEQLNPTSYDLTLGEDAAYLRSHFWDRKKLSLKEVSDFYCCTKDKPHYLAPNDFILASTNELIKLPSNVSARVSLKSSRAREGFSHALAGWVDPGFEGKLTLEIKNYLKDSYIPIYPGLKFVQITFYSHATVDKDYQQTATKGRYSYKYGLCPSLDQFPNEASEIIY